MGIPTDTNAYPAFAGATGKQEMLRALWASKDSMGARQGVMFQIANTPFSGCGDEDTIYTPEGVYLSA